MNKTILIIFGIIVFSIMTMTGQYYYEQLSVGLYLLAILSSIRIFNIHWSCGVAFLYSILNGIYYTFKFPSPFESYGFAGENLFRLVSAQSVLIIFLTAFSFTVINKKVFSYLARSLPWVCLTSTFIVLCNCLFGSYLKGGIMQNASMDPMMISFLYPTIFFLIEKKIIDNKIFKAIAGIAPIIAILLSGGSVGLGCMCISIFFIFFDLKKINLKNTTLAMRATITLFLVALLKFDGKLFSDSNRFWIYEAAYNWWTVNHDLFTGSGLGTFHGYGPLSQNLYWKDKVYVGDGDKHPLVIWMHSDWLQIVFELGIIGLLLVLILSYYLIKNCIKTKNKLLLASIMSYFGAMIFNMPLHWFPSLFCGAVLIKMGFMNEQEINSL